MARAEEEPPWCGPRGGDRGRRLVADGPKFAVGLTLLITAVSIAPAARALDAPRVHGSIRYDTFVYGDRDKAGDTWENYAVLDIRARGRLTDELTYRMQARMYADDVHFTAGAFSVRNDQRRRPYVQLAEGVVDYRPTGRLRISVGKQYVNWSAFDEIQPANVMSTRDESDPFRVVDLGLYGVALHYDHDFGDFEFFVVPMAFTPVRLPQGRWNIVRDNVAKIQDLPPVRVEETQAAIRLGFEVEQLEVDVFAYVGRDFSAVFIPEVVFVGGEDRLDVRIIDRYPRIRVGGMNATYPLSESLLARLETVYFSSPEDYQDNFIHVVIGGEYSFRDFRLVVNYLREEITKRSDIEITDKGERRFFRSLIFGEVLYDAGGRLRARFQAGYDTRGEFTILQPEISYRLWRELRAGLSGVVIDSKRGTDRYFDRIRHEDRFGADLTYSF